VAECSCSDRGFVPAKLTQPVDRLAAMSFAIALTNEQWELVADLFDPPGRRGAPAGDPEASARPHDVVAARELLRDRLPELTRLRAIVGDRAYRGLAKLAARRHVELDIKAPPAGVGGFTPLWPLYKVEHTIAQLGRWRRLSRCYEGTEASARAWLEVASVGYLAWRAAA
jgi:hypothetical protein